MKKYIAVAVFGLSVNLGLVSISTAQVAGTSTTSQVIDIDVVARGWSAEKSILGKTVFNENAEAIGKVKDLIIEPNRNVSYLIIAVGGFVGIGRHSVAVESSQIMMLDDRLVMQGATKAALTAMPTFKYTPISVRDRTTANAELVVRMADRAIVDMQQRLGNAADEVKAAMDRQIVELRADKNDLQAKINDMKAASERHWKTFEEDVNKAAARLKASIKRSTG